MDKNFSYELVELLLANNKKLSVAESITGGLIASKIVSVPNASQILFEGLVVYSEQSKQLRLNVPSALIKEKSAVSGDVCREMINGLATTSSADFLLTTTGYADGEKGGKVFIGTCGLSNDIEVNCFNFKGERNIIREQAANMAIYLIFKLATKELF